MSTTALATMTNKLAQRLDLGVDGSDLVDTLKATAFKGQVTDAQMVALLVVANQYGLNPWTKEIYAFPDSRNGIVPVVGVDGWSRIINSNENFDGMDFEQDDEKCTCVIYRKDRSHPIKVTEYMAECKRDGVVPWKSHPKRMLRHKAMIQCARVAFGYVGIYDEDEAERIIDVTPPSQKPQPQAKTSGKGQTINGQAEQVDDDNPPLPTPGTAQLVDAKHIKMLRAKLTSSNKAESDLLTAMEVAKIEDITFPDGLNGCLDWIAG